MAIKIALIRQEQTGSDGGAQTIIDLMMKTINSHGGVDLSLLCRKWDTADEIGEKVILNPSFIGRKGKFVSFLNAINKHLSTNHFDLIQSHERYDGCHIFRAGDGVHKVWLQHRSCKLNALQKIWLSMSLYHRRVLREERAMFASNTLKKVICNSQMIKKEILANFPIESSKVVVIYNSVDLIKYHPVDADEKKRIRSDLSIPLNTRVFIFPGSGFERKNLASAIKAFSALNSDCYLIVVGKDKHQKSYENLASQQQCADRVVFFGAQTRENMARFYQASDVLVLPTLYDPFPNVILEGFASGLPCITSTRCGAVDVLPGSNCGALIEPYDVNALSTAMHEYMDSQKVRTESLNARAVAERFTHEKMQDSLMRLYRGVLDLDN